MKKFSSDLDGFTMKKFSSDLDGFTMILIGISLIGFTAIGTVMYEQSMKRYEDSAVTTIEAEVVSTSFVPESDTSGVVPVVATNGGMGVGYHSETTPASYNVVIRSKGLVEDLYLNDKNLFSSVKTGTKIKLSYKIRKTFMKNTPNEIISQKLIPVQILTDSGTSVNFKG